MGELIALPRHLAGLRGTLLLRGRGGEGRGRKMGRPLTQIPGSAPAFSLSLYRRNNFICFT